MTKTAEEWFKEGDKFDDEGKSEEAIKCFNEAIALKPDHGNAYALKGFNLKKLGKYQEAAIAYEKAIECGFKQKWVYNNYGNLLTLQLKRREEAIKAFQAAFSIDPNYAQAFLNQGNALLGLGKVQEGKESFLKCISNNGKFPEAYSMVGSIFEEEGKKEDAMKYYNEGLAIDPKDYKCNLLKANLLVEQGKTDESLVIYKSMLNSWPTESLLNYHLAQCYIKIGKTDEAKKCYEQAAKMDAVTSPSFIAKGQCLNMLGRTNEAMECFKKAKDILEHGSEVHVPTFERSLKAALKGVLEAEELAEKVENEISKLDPNNSVVQKFKTNLKLLQGKKIAAQNQALEKVGKKQNDGKDHDLTELEQLKEEYNKQLADIKKEFDEFKHEVKKEIKTLRDNMEEMKIELDSKLDNFNKKLDLELNSTDLTVEDKKKIKGYFSAFAGTISSAYVSAQVVDSGQVQLDSNSNVASVLSFLASFTPFIGSALESGVKSIGDFLKSKEMITNARKMKRLASDGAALSQLVGKAGFEIVKNKDKQQKIINVNSVELKHQQETIIQKIYKLCDDISERIDALLYTNLYPTASEKMGHADANQLIEKWIKGKITPLDIEDQMINLVLSPPLEEEKPNQTQETANSGRSSCCNLF